MSNVYIYTLSDPITNLIRYVGKTKQPKERYKNHLNKKHNERTHKTNWINKLKSQNLKPIFEVIDVVDETEWKFWERYWYYQLKAWGCDLCNHTSGGDGLTFGNATSFKKGQGGKSVIALDKQGNYIARFNSGLEGRAFAKTKIDSCLSGKTKTSGGYLWLYESKYLTMSVDEIKEFVRHCNDRTKFLTNGLSTRFKQGSTSWNKGKSYTRKK